MSKKLKAQFRTINNELYGNSVQSGTCLDTLNTVVDGNSTLSGRIGFDAFDLNTDTLGEILNMFVATFLDGVTYVVTKRVDGKLYHWQAYPTPAAAWTLIKNKRASNVHSISDAGWFYMWADRMYYFDSLGGTKWDGTAASTTGTGVYKAGIEGTVGPILATLAAGAKEGWYHVTTTHYNSVTGEESILGGLQTYGSMDFRLSADSSSGGIRIDNWCNGDGTGICDKTADLDYEFDSHKIYVTMGNTERAGLGDGLEQYSYMFHEEMFTYTPSNLAASTNFDGIHRTDAIVATKPRLKNQGSQPPGAEYGCWNGSHAIYLQCYPKSKTSIHSATTGLTAIAPGVMMSSIRGFPCMVPQTIVFTLAGDSKGDNVFEPFGGSNEIASDIAGLITGCASVGNSFFIFTNSSTYQATPNAWGKMKPRMIDPAHGAVGFAPVVQAGGSVHAVGHDSWLRISREGVHNAAYEAFTPTMAAIPATGITATVGGYYSHRAEVWMAVAKTGGTANKAQRILIFDERQGGLTSIFDPTNLGAKGISAMCELSTPTQSPVMLIAMDDGNILKWPGTNYTDAATDGGSAAAYACSWQGLFGQENRAYDQKLRRLDAHMKENVTDGLTLGVSGHRSAARVDTDALVTKLIPKSKENFVDRITVDFGKGLDGNLYEVKFSSTTAQGAHWRVGDMILDIDRI